jgi:Fuc2NAc and GlcNAc transferase
LIAFLIPLSVLAAWALTGWVLRRAHALHLIDSPNERSSHSSPTPRGGGLAIAIVCTTLLGLRGLSPDRIDLGVLAIAVGGTVIATLGFLDDRYRLSARLRFAVQTAVVAAVVGVLGGMPDEVVAAMPWTGTWASIGLCVVVVLWFLNLFNFMDGIDGIAASQGVFMATGAAVLAGFDDAAAMDVTILGGVAAAALGFLIWNRPPARIFMGDVGSAYLGYLLPMLAIWISRDSPIDVWGFVVLGALFIGDASATLLRRTLSGHRWHEAHRSHVYQRLARRFGHPRVTLGYGLANVLVVFPLAWLATLQAQRGAVVALVTILVTTVAFWRLGAGRNEASDC